MHLRLPSPGPAVSRALCTAGALAALASPFTSPLGAQIGRPGVTPVRPSVYAITNARVVPVGSAEIPRGTVVVRDGLIAAVGPSDRTTAPADARVIDGAGMTVYPGFIDAHTSLGIPAPAGQQGGGQAAMLAMLAGNTQQQGASTSPNSRYPEGLQPEVSALGLMKITGDPFEGARSAGIATVLVAPRTGVFAGTSALVSVVPDAPQDILVRTPVALHIGFTPLRGQYPGSLLGVFAAIRQMFHDAQRYGALQAAYTRNPRGMRRPENDESLAALLPALRREMPVVMQASTAREIERALDLAKEFNLRAVISGGAEAHLVASRLRAENVPVIASLNFPRAPQNRAADADPEPVRVLRERVEAPKNAGRLATAGVTFAYTSGGMTNMTEFLPALRRTVDEGLSRERAIRALTTDAAQLLGVGDRLGTLEVGKIANLTIVRGDVFDAAGRVVHVMADGELFDVREAPAGRGAGGAAGRAADAAATAAANPAAGQWLLTVSLEGKEHRVTVELQQRGEAVSGSFQGALGTGSISNGSIDANGDVRFTAPITTDETQEATFNGTITGNQIRGTVTIVGEAPGTFVGSRPSARQGTRP